MVFRLDGLDRLMRASKTVKRAPLDYQEFGQTPNCLFLMPTRYLTSSRESFGHRAKDATAVTGFRLRV